jgi:hypothetical protein
MNHYNPSLALAGHGHGHGGHSSGHSGHHGSHSSHNSGHHSKNSSSKGKKSTTHVMDSSQINLINAHNKKIQAKEQTHRNILARRSTKTHPKLHSHKQTEAARSKKYKSAVQHNAQVAASVNPHGMFNSGGSNAEVNYAHSYNTDSDNNNNSSSKGMSVDRIIQNNSNVFLLGGLGSVIWMMMFPDGTSILGKKYGKPIGWGSALIMLGLGIYGLYRKNSTATTATESKANYSPALYFTPSKPIRTVANSFLSTGTSDESGIPGPAVTGNLDTDVIIPKNIITGTATYGSRNPANDTNHAYSYVSDVY